MSTPLLTIQISVILTEEGLELVYEDERVVHDAYNTIRFELSEQEAVNFEIQDFVANGHTYRVSVAHSTRKTPSYAWERLANGRRSPIFSEPVQLELKVDAIPATNSAPPASTTSTTVITKKGKPGDDLIDASPAPPALELTRPRALELSEQSDTTEGER